MEVDIIKGIKLICIFICTVFMISFCAISTSAEGYRYEENHRIKLTLHFSQNSATCYAKITGKAGTTSITNGVMTLTDSSGNVNTLCSGLSSNGNTLIVSRNVSGLVSGERYTLEITATVNSNTSSEVVSDYISGVC